MMFISRLIAIFFICFIYSHVASAKVAPNTERYLSFNAEIGVLKPEDSPYLGRQIGAQPNVFNFIEADENLELRSKGLSFGTNSFHGFRFFGDLQQGIANNNQAFPTLNPEGQILLIPGVGVGSVGAGFSLAGPNNQITNARYDIEHQYFDFMVGLEKEYKTSISGLNITPSFGLAYKQATTKNRFAGNIPFFSRMFDYQTKTIVQTISPVLGLDASYSFFNGFHVFAGANYAYDINKGKALDSLNFTGFAGQVAKITNDENTYSYDFKAGINYQYKNFPTISFQGNYKRFNNLPIINNRNGSRKSDISYSSADVLSGTLRVTVDF